MARKKNIKKRETLPDPTYDSDIVSMLTTEFQSINQNLIVNNDDIKPKKNKQKIRKKTIFIKSTTS